MWKHHIWFACAAILLQGCGTYSRSSDVAEAVQEPEASPVWDANTVVLQAEQLADGVYAITPSDALALAPRGVPIATTSGIVAGEDGLLIIDTMLNERLANQVRAIAASVSDKPIRYLVNTSFHGDHSYGNYVFPNDAVIIQHAYTKEYVNAHFEDDRAFMLDNFGAGRGIEEVIAETGDVLIPEGGELTLDLGGREVLIKDFGFAQTGGDVFVWLPEEKIMWTGNPVIAESPALPWLLDGHLIETLETLKAVRAFLPDDAIVVPGHGPVTDVGAIDWNISYLTAVRDAVQAAIDGAATLEEAVEAATLPEYDLYALYDWVHLSLNVPAAYRDLTK